MRKRGGLAAAGRPEHGKEGAIVDREVRALHGGELIERLAQVFDADLCHDRAYSGKWLTMTKPSVPARIVTNE